MGWLIGFKRNVGTQAGGCDYWASQAIEQLLKKGTGKSEPQKGATQEQIRPVLQLINLVQNDQKRISDNMKVLQRKTDTKPNEDLMDEFDAGLQCLQILRLRAMIVQDVMEGKDPAVPKSHLGKATYLDGEARQAGTKLRFKWPKPPPT